MNLRKKNEMYLEELESIEVEEQEIMKKILHFQKMKACQGVDLELVMRLAEKINLHEDEGYQKIIDLSRAEKANRTELSHCRDAFIEALQGCSSSGSVGIKMLGEISKEAFEKACLTGPQKSNAEREAESLMLTQEWHDNIRSPNWHPFKAQLSNGEVVEVINEEDEQLGELRKTMGNEAYEAVITALMEVRKFNLEGNSPVPEIWNFMDNCKATLLEALHYLTSREKVLKE